MTSSNDNQTGNEQDNKEFTGTVKLMRCEKHGTTFYLGEGCPECEKEKKPSQ